MKRTLPNLLLDDETGELLASEARFVLLPAGFFITSLEQIGKIVGQAAPALLFRIGCGIGEEYVNMIKRAADEYGETLDTDLLLLEAYENALYQSGFGMIRLKDLDVEKPRIILEVANSPTKDEKGCDLFRGIIAGIATEVLGECACNEVEHGETCVFEVVK
ncbi:MAG: hypothetical protein V3R93_05590 [Candidatus Hydrothermarchaeaceae archaeon]